MTASRRGRTPKGNSQNRRGMIVVQGLAARERRVWYYAETNAGTKREVVVSYRLARGAVGSSHLSDAGAGHSHASGLKLDLGLSPRVVQARRVGGDLGHRGDLDGRLVLVPMPLGLGRG